MPPIRIQVLRHFPTGFGVDDEVVDDDLGWDALHLRGCPCEDIRVRSEKFEELFFDVFWQRGSDLDGFCEVVLSDRVHLQLLNWCSPSLLFSAVQAFKHRVLFGLLRSD